MLASGSDSRFVWLAVGFAVDGRAGRKRGKKMRILIVLACLAIWVTGADAQTLKPGDSFEHFGPAGPQA